MTAADVALAIFAWLVLIALIVAFFRGAKWIDRVVDEEMNQTFSVRGGAHGPPGIGVQREQ